MSIIDGIKENSANRQRNRTTGGLAENYRRVQESVKRDQVIARMQAELSGDDYIEQTPTEGMRSEIDAMIASSDPRLQKIGIDNLDDIMKQEANLGTTDMQEWRMAVSQGYEGTLEDWLNDESARKSSSGAYGNQPMYFRDADENVVIGRYAPDGTIIFPEMVDADGNVMTPMLPRGVAASDLISVREIGAANIQLKVDELSALEGPTYDAARRIYEMQAELENEKFFARDIGKHNIKIKQEINANRGQDWSTADRQRRNLETFNDVADKAISMINGRTVGWFGSIMANIGGTDAMDLSAELQVMMSRAGIDELIRSKQEGATYGSLSDKELITIQSYQAAIMQFSSKDSLVRNIEQLRTYMGEVWERIKVTMASQGRGYNEAGPNAPIEVNTEPLFIPPAATPATPAASNADTSSSDGVPLTMDQILGLDDL